MLLLKIYKTLQDHSSKNKNNVYKAIENKKWLLIQINEYNIPTHFHQKCAMVGSNLSIKNILERIGI